MQKATITGLTFLLAAFIVLHVAKVANFKKQLLTTEGELYRAKTELETARQQLQQVNNQSASSGNNMTTQIGKLQSSASAVEQSLNVLMSELKWIKCDACPKELQEIQLRSNNVKRDFDELQSNLK